MATFLLFRSGRYLTWARLGLTPGFEELYVTNADGTDAADITEEQIPPLGDFLCQVELPDD